MDKVGATLDTVFGKLELRPPRSATEANHVSLFRCRSAVQMALMSSLRFGNIYDVRVLASRVCQLPVGASAEEVTAGLMQALDRGRLVVASPGEVQGDGNKEAWSAYATFRGRLGREFMFGGQRHRLAQREQVESLRQESDYDVVRAEEAAGIVKRLAQSAGTGPWQKAADVLVRYLSDLHGAASPDSFVLLRAPLSQAARLTLPEDVITPAKLKELAAKDWIEIHLVDEDGNPWMGSFEIAPPQDQKRAGVPDENGIIRLDKILSGTCDFDLPDLAPSAFTLGSPKKRA